MNPTTEGSSSSSSARVSDVERWLRLLLPVIAAVSLGAFLAARRISIERDLRVVVPERVVVGMPFPVRVLLYGDLRAVEGARLFAEPVEVALLDRAGQVISEGTRLGRGFANSLEGSLTIPGGARPPIRLRARHIEGATETRLTLRLGPRKPRLPPPRAVRALQRMSLGPVHVSPGESAPDGLSLAVVGGSCVPESPCRVLVYVGHPAAAVEIVPSRSVGVTGPARDQEVAGVVSIDVLVHGPEAIAELRVRRGSALVARRQVRLPVALGVPATTLAGLAEGSHWAKPALRLLSDPGPCILDLFRDGQLLWSATIAECAEPFELARVARFGPGPLRAQIRRDPFASASASVRVVDLPAAGEAPSERLARLVERARARRPADPLVRACVRSPTGCAAGRHRLAVGYLLAVLEDGVFPIPVPASGHARAVGRLLQQQARVRIATFLSLGLCGLTLAAMVARRGLSGGAQGRAWMASADAAPNLTRRARRRSWLVVWSSVAALMLAFVAVALYVAARGISQF